MSDYPGFNGMEVVSKETVTQSGRMGVPGVCVLTGDGDGPFLDTGTVLNAKEIGTVDPYALISVAKVIDMGRAVGMVPRHEFEALLEDVRNLEHKYENLDRYREAVEELQTLEISDPPELVKP